MAKKGHIVTDQHRLRLSESHKGQRAWNKGKKGIYSNDSLEKMRLSAKNRKRHIVSEETKNKIRLRLKGKKHGPMSDECKAKLSLANKGKHQDHTNRKSRKGMPTGIIPKSAFKTGQRPWNYVDGRSTRLDLKNRYGREWPKIRGMVIDRDGYMCQKCKCDNIFLEVHHIIPYLISRDNSLENLISLCKKCHREIESIEMKRMKNKLTA